VKRFSINLPWKRRKKEDEEGTWAWRKKKGVT